MAESGGFKNVNDVKRDPSFLTGAYDESKGVVAHNAVHHSKQCPSELKITAVKK
jgi:hypothetical protein